MKKEILVNVEPQQVAVAITDQEGKLEEFYIERPQEKTVVGNIYKGKVDTVIPSLNAAFVNFGFDKKGFLYLSKEEHEFEPGETKDKDLSFEVKKGQDILVQVVKEAFGTKGARISSEISLPGRYLVLMPQDHRLGVSRRIEDEAERVRLKGILQDLKLPKGLGFIVRTAASGKTKQQLKIDARFLLKMWSRITKVARYRQAPSLIYEEYDLILRVVRDSFTEDVSRLIIDSKTEYRRVLKFVRSFLRHLCGRIELYRGEDLFLNKNIQGQINKIFEKKIFLKSGAYIVIEPTEGLVVVDVNSGGFKKKLSPEESAFRVNREAAKEIAHQLRLRDLGGIIVIDFIDMEKEGHRKEILHTLKKELNLDRAKYDVLGISKFGLVEMTRERIHKTIHAVSYQDCPYCQGRGKIKSPLTMSIYALKELRRYLKSHRLRSVKLTLNPSVASFILQDRRVLHVLERKFRSKIELISNPALHIEDLKIS